MLGAGALSSPLVATQFAQLPHWSFHYLCSLGVALINTVLLIVVFGLKTQDGMWDNYVVEEMAKYYRLPHSDRTARRREGDE